MRLIAASQSITGSFADLSTAHGEGPGSVSFSTLSGAKEEGEALSVLIALLDQRCLLRLAV